MLYFAGDTHGVIEINKIMPDSLAEQGITPTPDDYVIVAGDFGLVFNDPPTEDEIEALDMLNDLPWTTLFVDGNHENFDLINSYPTEEWNGGSVHKIRPKVIHLMRAQLYKIDGLRVFTFGGAETPDSMPRTEGENWWHDEMPNDEDKKRALDVLDACDNKVDIIVTHCAPSMVQYRESYGFGPNHLTDFLEYLRDTVSFKRWFYGHYHQDREFGDGFVVLYNQIVAYEGE